MKPLRLPFAFVLFAVPSAIITFLLFTGIERLEGMGAGPFLIFNLTFVLPLGLLFVAPLVAYRIEKRPWAWAAFADRMRLEKMGASGWVWAVALAVFMFQPLGTPRLYMAFTLAVIAVGLDRGIGRVALPSLVGLLIFFGIVWALPNLVSTLSGVVFYNTPLGLTRLFQNITPTSFMGIELSGQWWLIVYYLAVVMFLNIVGEELWWRGYILPRQELAHGRWAWVIHGTLWTLFHIFQTPNLAAVAVRLPGMLALAYVCQRNRSTWPGIVGHFVGNSPFLILISNGVVN